MIPEIEYKPIFFAAIAETLLDVTMPDSNRQKPSAINITKKPDTKNKKLFKIYAVSSETSAKAEVTNSDEKITVKDKILFNIFFLR
tara:strand:+ start:2678 stop:2935 length:258 start_codon:yes stop_codon:yes gene_type:complete